MKAVAKAGGWKDASGYQRYEDPNLFKDDYLSLKIARRIAQALVGQGKPAITLDEVMELAGVYSSGDRVYPTDISAAVHLAVEGQELPAASEESHGDMIDPARRADLSQIANLPRDVPVLGVAVGGDDGDFQLNGQTIDFVRRPPGIAKAVGVFAIYMAGDSMYPWRSAGDAVYVNPGRQPAIGDYVMVELTGASQAEPGRAMVKRLVARTAREIRLAQFNPARDDIRVPMSKVKAIYRVIDWPELLGI